jgi:hypothetical protein
MFILNSPLNYKCIRNEKISIVNNSSNHVKLVIDISSINAFHLEWHRVVYLF